MENLNIKTFNLESLIEFRHWVHENAELSLVEFNTHKKIKEYGLNLGVPEAAWIECAKTGWKVDIKGRGPAFGKPRMIAVRSDHDALPIVEKNPHLPYASKSNVSHMCGHDGHTACLLGGMALLMDNLEKIPSDRTVRFIFQPAEECLGGAHTMVKEGILDGVDEVYGCHNLPISEIPEQILIADREMLADMQELEITIHGKGGHGSTPEKCNNPIPIACRAYMEIIQGLTEYQKQVDSRVRFSLTTFNAGNANNVIPYSVVISGTLRNFSTIEADNMEDIIRKVLDRVTSETDSRYDMIFKRSTHGAVVNDPKYAQYIRKYAKDHYGENMVTNNLLPVYASEDFAEYLQTRPGAFFLRVGRNLPPGSYVHTDTYDFDDGIIEDLSKFWFRIMYERLNSE